MLKRIFYDKDNIQKYIYNIDNIDDFLPPIIENMTFEEFIMEYHLYMHFNYKKVKENNNKMLNDKFFKSLLELIKKRNKISKLFNKKILEKIGNE